LVLFLNNNYFSKEDEEKNKKYYAAGVFFSISFPLSEGGNLFVGK